MRQIRSKVSKARGTDDALSKGRRAEPDRTLPYHMSVKSRSPLNIYEWTYAQEDDPSFTDFIPKLKDHLFLRLFPSELDRENRSPGNVLIKDDIIHKHIRLRVNYTSYDNQRESDTINPKSHPYILIPKVDCPKKGEPYDYARMLSAFRVEVSYLDFYNPMRWECLDFLWIQRFQYFPASGSPFSTKRYPKIKQLAEFGFIDPAQVIRGAHLIPAFIDGQSEGTEGREWRGFYVNM